MSGVAIESLPPSQVMSHMTTLKTSTAIHSHHCSEYIRMLMIIAATDETVVKESMKGSTSPSHCRMKP